MRLSSIKLLHAKTQFIPSWIPSWSFAAGMSFYSIKYWVKSPCSISNWAAKPYIANIERRRKWCARDSKLWNLILPDFIFLSLQFPEWWGFLPRVKHRITFQKLNQTIILCKEDTDLYFANGCKLLQKKRKDDTLNCTTLLEYLEWLISGKHLMITKVVALFLVENPLPKFLHFEYTLYPSEVLVT